MLIWIAQVERENRNMEIALAKLESMKKKWKYVNEIFSHLNIQQHNYPYFTTTYDLNFPLKRIILRPQFSIFQYSISRLPLLHYLSLF